jgi:hypothetical protein
VRAICNEMDHHPEWTLNNNTLEVKLTSHFIKNNVSETDYALAAEFSETYDRTSGVTGRNQDYLTYLIGAAIIFGIGFVSNILYQERLYRVTSMDFMFAKVDTKDNEYVKKRFEKY